MHMEALTPRPVLPPAATPQVALIASPDTANPPAPVVDTPSIQTVPLRRSQRQAKSTFDGHLKDYAK